MEFRGPEVGIFAPLRERVAEDFALGFDHQFFEAADREFAAGAFLVELFLELIAHGDVEQEDRTVANLLVEGAGLLGRAEGRVGEDALGEDHFAEGRGRFGQSHRIEVGVGAHVAHDVAVEGVADLVGEREHIAEGVVVGHIDAGLAGQKRASAKGPRPLARAGRVLNPLAFADLAEELA